MNTRTRIDSNPEHVEQFMLAGAARFTIVSKKTGNRFTYRVRKPKGNITGSVTPFFVSVLSGPDNTSDYAFLGTIRKQESGLTYTHSYKSYTGVDAQSVRALQYFVNACNAKHLDQLEVWHEGRCCRCGRVLTVPESIAAGIGPECANKA